MWFYTVAFFILVLVNGTAYFFRISKIGYIISLLFLSIVAAFRPATCCADYSTYIEYYNNLSALPLTFLEPTYFLISYLSEISLNSYVGVFIIYSILGVGLKGLGIFKLTKYYSFSLLVYFASFFLLHEMTQIRVGVASAFLLLSIPFIQQKSAIKFYLLVLLGCAFHYSLLIFLPFYFINPNAINKKLYIISIFAIFIVTLIGVNFITIIQFIKLGFLSDKIAAYQIMLDDGLFGDIKLLNPLLFLRIALAIFFIIMSDKLILKNKYAVIITKIYVFSILAFIGLSPLPALAGRINQLLGVVEIVLVPFSIYLFRPKYIPMITVIVFALMIMYKQLYYSDLMKGYFK